MTTAAPLACHTKTRMLLPAIPLEACLHGCATIAVTAYCFAYFYMPWHTHSPVVKHRDTMNVVVRGFQHNICNCKHSSWTHLLSTNRLCNKALIVQEDFQALHMGGHSVSYECQFQEPPYQKNRKTASAHGRESLWSTCMAHKFQEYSMRRVPNNPLTPSYIVFLSCCIGFVSCCIGFCSCCVCSF